VPGLQPTVQSFGKNKSGYDVYLIQTLPTGEVETIYNALDAAYDFQRGRRASTPSVRPFPAAR